MCGHLHLKLILDFTVPPIVWKIGQTASEEVVLQFVKSKCMPILLQYMA